MIGHSCRTVRQARLRGHTLVGEHAQQGPFIFARVDPLGGVVFAGRDAPDRAGAEAADEDGSVGGGGDAFREEVLAGDGDDGRIGGEELDLVLEPVEAVVGEFPAVVGPLAPIEIDVEVVARVQADELLRRDVGDEQPDDRVVRAGHRADV